MKIKKFVIKFNFLILALNIIFLILKISILKSKLNKFKFSDNFNIIFMNKTYLEIASYLNKKFDIFYSKNKLTKPNIKDNKKEIKIWFLRFMKGFNPNSILKKLDNEKFIFKLDNNTPDYLVYNPQFSKNYSDEKYKNAIKLSFCTENTMPNLTEVDYAIGYMHINYLDRYFKFFKYFKLKLFIKIINSRKYALKNKKRKLFCAAVISNYKSGDFLGLNF